jgi:hypothetical protein
MTSAHDPMEANLAALEAILDRLEHLGDPAIREDARAVVTLLLRWHRDALARLVSLAAPTAEGAGLLDSWKRDPLVAALLLLHGLHPDPIAESSPRRVSLPVVATLAEPPWAARREEA